MGVTGSGKTFTMANVIQQLQRPTLVLSHNKTLAAQLYGEFKEFFPHNAVQLLRQLLRLLPARGLHPAARHLHREGRLDQRGDRPPAAGGHQRPGQPPRRDHRGQRVVHLRLGLARRLQGDDGRPARSARRSTATTLLAQAGRHPVRAERHRLRARQVPRARRLRRGLAALRGVRLPHRVLGRRGRAALDHQPDHRRDDRQAGASCSSTRPSTSSCPRSGSPGPIDAIKQELDERLEQFKNAGQAARGPAAQRPHAVRHRDDAGGRLLPGHRELQPAALAAARRASRRTRCSTSFPTTSCCSSTSRTSRCRRSAACTPATAAARRRWSSTASACRARWTTGR